MTKTLNTFYRTFLTATIIASGAVTMQAAPKDAQPELSDQVSSSLTSLQPLFDQKNWDGVITLIDGLLAKVGPNSYDRAFLLQMEVQPYALKSDTAKMINALETSLRIADSLDIWRFKGKIMPIGLKETLTYLSSLWVQDAQIKGKSLEEQRASYGKALGYVRRLVALTPHPAPEHQSLLAQVLFYQATVDPKKVDTTLLKEALAEIEKALLLTVEPKEAIYTMQLAIYQQLGAHEKSAEVLELLIQKYPNNKSYWNFLYNTYLAMEGGDLRAILTLERSQALGLMKTPKDNFTLAALYYNIMQFNRSAELLQKGLRSGDIESVPKNWGLLADSYQRLGMDDAAIGVFKEASAKFPQIGNYDLQIGQIYFGRDNQEEALKFMRSAVGKDLEQSQRAQTYYFIAYLSMQLKRLDDALPAAQKAVELDPRSKTNKSLLDAINKSIAARDAFKNSRA